MTKEQKLIIGQQHLSHEQGVRRLAFFFAVADNVGYLTFYHFCIQTGEDVRKLVTLTERHSPAKK